MDVSEFKHKRVISIFNLLTSVCINFTGGDNLVVKAHNKFWTVMIKCVATEELSFNSFNKVISWFSELETVLIFSGVGFFRLKGITPFKLSKIVSNRLIWEPVISIQSFFLEFTLFK
jgi:hypothetical protein